jgi:macrolide export ATP-binding/permease protein macB
MDSAVIKIKNIKKSFDNKIIFCNFSENIFKNEIVAIVGKSGSGKTTLLNMIGGLEKIESGEIYINNLRVIGKNKIELYRNQVSFLFQNFALVDEWTVEKNLKIALTFKKREKGSSEILKVLKMIGLEDKLKEKIYKLSGGEQQRVALARIYLQDNPVILADEPTASLDKENRDLVFSLLRRLQKEKGKTIVIVTHDQELANFCDRVIELSNFKSSND